MTFHESNCDVCPNKPTVEVKIPQPSLYVNVRGRGVTNTFGVATYPINSPADVQIDLDTGCLVIKMAAHTKRIVGEVREILATSVVYNERSWDRFDVRPVKPRVDQAAIDHYDRCHGPRRQGNYVCCINPVDPRTVS